MEVKPEVAEYLVLVYKCEKSVSAADPEKVRQWGRDALEAVASRYKDASEQLSKLYPRKKKKAIPRDFIDSFASALGGAIGQDGSFDLPDDAPSVAQAINAGKILMAHAFEMQAFPRFAWGLACIVLSVLSVVGGLALAVSFDWIGVIILAILMSLAVYCFVGWRGFARFEDAARQIKERVQR